MNFDYIYNNYILFWDGTEVIFLLGEEFVCQS